MAITLQLNSDFFGDCTVPLEVDTLCVDRFRELNLDEIKRQLVWQGKTKIELGEVFQISGEFSDQTLVWQGNLSRVHWIGSGMSSGKVIIEGDVGRHLGSQMSGGQIHVNGSAGDFVGIEITGGTIKVDGNAGDRVGARYPGSKYGMNRGSIFVKGSAGNAVGENMRRGSIVIEGDCGAGAGWNMLAGTLCVFGSIGANPGAGMVRGTIVSCGTRPDLLPTFIGETKVNQSQWIQIYSRWLANQGVDRSSVLQEIDFEAFAGDTLHGGRGEMLFPVDS